MTGCIDVGEPVTGTNEGSGTSATGTEGRFHSLAHLIDVPALERAYHRVRKDGAVGVDGVTKEQYGGNYRKTWRICTSG